MVIKHKQIPVKVTAYVDEGIKELVEALNDIEGVTTFDSCEGYTKQAHVYIRYEDTFYFAENLAKVLSQLYEADVSILWLGDKKHPFIALELPRCQLKKAVQQIRRLKPLSHENNLDKQHGRYK